MPLSGGNSVQRNTSPHLSFSLESILLPTPRCALKNSPFLCFFKHMSEVKVRFQVWDPAARLERHQRKGPKPAERGAFSPLFGLGKLSCRWKTTFSTKWWMLLCSGPRTNTIQSWVKPSTVGFFLTWARWPSSSFTWTAPWKKNHNMMKTFLRSFHSRQALVVLQEQFIKLHCLKP